MNRREFLQWVGAGSAVLVLPIGCASSSGFLTAAEKRTLAQLADGILPPDDQPGGSALGAVEYVEQLLTALDHGEARVYLGGPYSGRTPFVDANGAPSANFPADGFLVPLPLERAQLLAWKLRLYGSRGVSGGGPNDAVLGPIVGLRDQIRQGLAQAQGQTIDQIDPDFRDTLYALVSEAAFGAPEYGGNPGQAGWAMVHFEGDSQPLGYSMFDVTAMIYRERADAPVSTANPGADPEPLDAQTRSLLNQVVAALGGKTF